MLDQGKPERRAPPEVSEVALRALARTMPRMVFMVFDGYHVHVFWRGEQLRFTVNSFLYTIAFSWSGQWQ